ncbi:hypothetical protein [Heyndrickxia acidicola]|uniref:Uncharacterized protein n=1 Tax=Heyndrickxia acidicola TaxID=209389 RepID=A0ABU6MQL5_9BACI|nr:hypothetical protein [Heyndrickxia acidicola]MED1205517.1 hypothetical protein [Heyndrickxia acidicola]
MAFAICVLITWFVICTLSIIPKTFKAVDLIFIYFLNTIFELSIFSLFHINLHWFNVGTSTELAFADLVLRLVMVPLVFVIATQILFYSVGAWKWLVQVVIILLFIPFSKFLEYLKILHLTQHWNMFYTILMFFSYAFFSWLMGKFMIFLDRKEGEQL